MTIEEAVEIVLSGTRWVMCPDCSGFGVVAVAPGSMTAKKCESCEQHGTVITARYAEACKILGKELPTAKPNIRIMGRGSVTFSDGAIHAFSHPTFELADD